MRVRLLFIKYNIAALLVAILAFEVNAQTQNLVIEFQNFVGDKPLHLDKENYKNILQQSFTVTMFKYYIGNIHLLRDDGKEFVSKEYFLVNEDEPQSKKIILRNVPKGNYTAINFILGVDSLHNCSGAQDGALDPVNGMFWAWNTGYIFMKLEGMAPVSKSPAHILEYHIGGYKPEEKNNRGIRIVLNNFSFLKGKSIVIKTDILKILSGKNEIDFSETSSVTDIQHGKIIADNYANIFSLLK